MSALWPWAFLVTFQVGLVVGDVYHTRRCMRRAVRHAERASGFERKAYGRSVEAESAAQRAHATLCSTQAVHTQVVDMVAGMRAERTGGGT